MNINLRFLKYFDAKSENKTGNQRTEGFTRLYKLYINVCMHEKYFLLNQGIHHDFIIN